MSVEQQPISREKVISNLKMSKFGISKVGIQRVAFCIHQVALPFKKVWVLSSRDIQLFDHHQLCFVSLKKKKL